jgi:DNA-binding Lrp family transcriptional regulator
VSTLTQQARAFINQFQGGFPIAGRPFHGVAARLGMQETALIQTVRQLLDDQLLSRFGPLYDTDRLGGGVTLAALSAPEADFERVARLVNRLPAVAHNYRRGHALNMWFVVASSREQGVDECLEMIAAQTGLRVYSFPKLHEFYLGLWLEFDGEDGVKTVPVPESASASVDQDCGIDMLDRRIVAATQAGLPLVAEPYVQLAEDIDLPVDELMRAMRRLLSVGVIRRIGAVPNHYRLGLRGNGMTVWDVPDELAISLGERVGALDFVSHAYLRPRHEDVWPYNLFAMVHGRDRTEVLEKSAQLRRVLGEDVRGHDVLLSTAVLKKTGLRLVA